MDLWKTRQVISISGAKPISGKLVDIWMSFPEIGLCHARNSTNVIFRLNALFWMGFPENGLWHAACLKILKLKIG